MNAALMSGNTQNVLILKYIWQGSCVLFEGTTSEGPSQPGLLSGANLMSDVWEPSVLTLKGLCREQGRGREEEEGCEGCHL